MPRNFSSRNSRGFTLVFALMLCVIFATLLLGIYYFLKQNIKQAKKDTLRLQAQYIAEAGNSRALSRINIKTLPDIEDVDLDDEDDEDDFFDDEDDDEFFDEDDEDFFDDEDDDDDFFGDDIDSEILAEIPRYINFYLKNPFFVNIESGAVVSEAQFLALVSQQRAQLAAARAAGDENVENVLLIEEIYLPLPEVNVQRIGSITIPKGAHLKEGFKIILAEKTPVDLKLNDIREEFLNIIPPQIEAREKPVLRNIAPNNVQPGDITDISLEGDALEDMPISFSSGDIKVIDTGSNLVSIDVSEKAKPGRYRMRVGPLHSEFYIVPKYEGLEPPEIENILVAKDVEDSSLNQFTRIRDLETVKGLKIKGFNLGDESNVPVIIPDAKGITAEIVSINSTEITFNLSIKNASLGPHSISVYTKGGQSDIWIFNVDEKIAQEDFNPNIATYSTVMTLLEVESLSNIPIGQDVSGLGDGRPDQAGGGDRPEEADEEAGLRAPRVNRNFDLLKSDLESVWKIETVATINKVSYRSTNIVRRRLPNVKAALTTNNKVTFGTGDMTVEGIEQARTTLQDASASKDTTIVVEGTDPDEEFFAIDDADRPPDITGQAVIEDLGLGLNPGSPAARGFKEGGIVAILDPTTRSEFTDYSIVESVGQNTITVEAPGFENSHFVNDEVLQFIPSVITPFGISERQAQKHLVPESSHIRLDGKETFEFVFNTRLEDMEDWSGAKTDNTSVPDDIFSEFEGYFGLHIIEGTPNYDGANSLIGQGILIVDTTRGGANPFGGTVKIGGSSRLPSEFDGVIYIIGDLTISGGAELNGAVVVASPTGESTVNIDGQGFIKYNPISVTKSIIGLPFARQLHSRLLEKSKISQEEFLKKHSGALKALSSQEFKTEQDLRKELEEGDDDEDF